MEDPKHLVVERSGRIARVWLARPQVRNAFNAALIAELDAVVAALGQDESLRAIVLGGQGPAFCAGGDLAWMRAAAAQDWAANQADADALAGMLWTLDRCPLPLVGRVQGDCYGGGLGLVSVCDVVVAADDARFCFSEARLGLLPATIAPYALRAIGERAARRYFATAERFDAPTAQRLGLVHELVPTAELDARLDAVLAALLTNGPEAVKACKALAQDYAGRPISPALRADSARRIADARASAEGREGIQAFLDKRRAGWIDE